MLLEEFMGLPSAGDAPVMVKNLDAQGQVTGLAIRVEGVFASRLVNALVELTQSQGSVEVDHPYFQGWLVEDGLWVITRPGNAGWVKLREDGQALEVEDGFGVQLFSVPLHELAQVLDPYGLSAEIERVARYLRQQVTGERVCRKCGCTPSWGCEDGCDWAEADLCTGCETVRL